MKTLKIFSTVFSVCLIISQNGADPPITSETSSLATTDQLYCSRQGISCYDRYTIQYCGKTGDSGLEFTVSCKVQNPNRPYCLEYENHVECIPADTSIPLQEKPETCTSQGSRPDPLDCTRFIRCEKKPTGNGYFGSVVNCPIGTGYNIDREKCQTSGSCATIHSYCLGNEDKLIAYSPYPSIYVKCPAANSKDEFVVKLCKEGYSFEEEVGACERICKREGYIPNNENCKAYYNCVKITGDLFSISSNICPLGTGFNRQTNACDESKASCSNSRFRNYFNDY
ncbi:uncharacterized protein LOC123292686 [Chrysoperla carnea]|uniref:uncharacterized protein LOC123292686 n=1 Tax=Chrysoperla carnea TaxID=189513 RepID=UPI001D080B25|nr:uncharacterized protein LOC123292686 [Chrysoperla carnea]